LATVVAVNAVDEFDLAADVADVVAAHASIVDHLRRLDPIDSATPSLLPDWTVGHVLTHVARHADGVVNVMNDEPQYPRGLEGRNADIESGSGRDWAELVDDVETTCAAVDAAFDRRGDWSGTATMLAGERPLSMVPFLRLREVEVHHADLGLGYDFADMPARYLRKELRMMEMLWRARKPMGMTPLPGAALALPPSTRLAWLMGRTRIDGLEPAALF
jgi:maleylpyruvate isomerase